MVNLLLRKTVEQIQTEANTKELKRTLGKWNLLSLGIGCIIGAGIFVMTGTAAAEHAGPALMISFIFTGIACAFVGLCYAELASVLPISGSAYTYAYATLGESLAWVMGWLLLLEYGVAASTVAVGWSGYVNSFLLGLGLMIPPELTVATGQLVKISDVLRPLYESHHYAIKEILEQGKPVPYLANAAGELIKGVFNLPAFVGIVAVSSLLVVGVSESAKVNNVIVFIKVAVVLMFVVIGGFYVNPANWHPFIPTNIAPGVYGWDGVFRAASIIFFAYVGFEAVSTAAQEAKNPQKDMPFGILGSLLVCTILYIGVSAVLTGIVPYQQLGVADPMAVAVDKIGLGWFAFLIKIGAILGLSSVMMVLIYGQTRIFYVMARDGLLPAVFSSVHKRFKTPHINTIVVGLVVAVAAGVTPIELLGDLVSLGTLLAFMIVCFSVIYLRNKQPDLARPFHTPGMPFTPLLGIATCGYLVYSIFFGTEGQSDWSNQNLLVVFGPFAVACVTIVLLSIRYKLPKALRTLKAGIALQAVSVLGLYLSVVPFLGEKPPLHIVLTESGHKVLQYTGPYMLIGAVIYVVYGIRHSKLRLSLAADPFPINGGGAMSKDENPTQ